MLQGNTLVSLNYIIGIELERCADSTLIMHMIRMLPNNKVVADIRFEIDEAPRLLAALQTMANTDNVLSHGTEQQYFFLPFNVLKEIG